MRKTKVGVALVLLLFCLPLFRAEAVSKADLEKRIEDLEKQNEELSKQLEEITIRLELLVNRMDALDKGVSAQPVAKPPEKGASAASIPPNLEIVKLKPKPEEKAVVLPKEPPGGDIQKIKPTPWPEKPVIRVGDVNIDPPQWGSEPLDDEPVVEEEENLEALALFEDGLKLFEKKDYKAAVQKFEDYMLEASGEQGLDKANFLLGDCYYNLGNNEKALENFDTVTNEYPESPKAPEALFKTGLIFMEQEKLHKAKEAFRDLTILYPFSDLVREAEEKLEEINAGK